MWEDAKVNESDEILYGRVGYLLSLKFLKKKVGDDIIPNELYQEVIDTIIYNGKENGNDQMPLNYYWHGKDYWYGSIRLS